MNEDQKVSQRYRELGREEPPRHLDEAILAASRRAARVHPAPLVPPTGRRRWYFPLAAAAVIVLSVAVTWRMQVERPDPDGYVASTQEKPEAQPELKQERQAAASPAPAPAPAAKPFTPDPSRAARDEMRAAPAPQAAPPPEVAASRMEERSLEERSRESAPMAGARAPEAARAEPLFRKQLAEEPPEKWLERIAELRKLGKHDEADKALEEFRKRYPDYKLPESALKK